MLSLDGDPNRGSAGISIVDSLKSCSCYIRRTRVLQGDLLFDLSVMKMTRNMARRQYVDKITAVER